MKSDMAGAGAVLGAMTTLAALDARVRVTGLLCCAENLPSGTAQRPGDVITQYDGTTVEVINTDAEGRLVLADGIGYAVANLAPDVIVDIATLTGAITVALGRGIGGLFASDDDLAAQLAASADRGGDPVWHMPVVDEYRVMLDSPVADFANVGTSTSTWVPMPRSINASVFLKHFARGVPWAHLDVAGPARNDADRPDCPKGGTGFGVRLFVDWLTGLGR
jgi:leucyl aminopeptidase